MPIRYQMPTPQAQPTFMGELGGGLGRGLSSGIGTLIDMKLQRMQQQQQANQITESLSSIMPKDKATAIGQAAAVNPQLAAVILKDALEGPGQAAYNQAIARAEGPPQGVAPGVAQAPQAVEGMVQAPQVQPVEGAAQGPQAAQAPQLVNPVPAVNSKAAMIKNLQADIAKKEAALPLQSPKFVPKLQAKIDGQRKRLEKLQIAAERESEANVRHNEKLASDEKEFKFKVAEAKEKNERADRKLDDEIRKTDSAEALQKLKNKQYKRERLDKRYDPFMAKQVEAHTVATEDLRALNTIETLDRDPTLTADSPSWMAFTDYLSKVGFKEDLLRGTPSQIMSKVVADINKRTVVSLKGLGIRAGSIFDRILKRDPAITQGPLARQYVVKTLKEAANLARKQAQMAKDAYKDNDYQYYKGFSEKIIEKMQPEYDKTINSFGKTMKALRKDKSLLKKQRRYERQQTGATVGGAVGGTAGTIGTAILGAKAGGAAGSVLGPVGTVGGALLGGLGGGVAGYLGGANIGSKIAEHAPKIKEMAHDIADVTDESADVIQEALTRSLYQVLGL